MNEIEKSIMDGLNEALEYSKGKIKMNNRIKTHNKHVGVQFSAVRKTVLIPSWLNRMADRDGINLSQILQDALKNLVGL